MKIAVIGAGIFGCQVSIELAKHDYKVVLFEKNSDLLRGATANSQNRLHLGLHYPRDLETAIQSVSGFSTFKATYPDAIHLDFKNYYAIAKNNSRVSAEEFEAFCGAADIKIRKLESNLELPNGLLVRDVDRIWECGEGVIDMEVLREILRNEIATSSVDLRLNCEVEGLSKRNGKWFVAVENEELDFDFVVRCTYSSDDISIDLEDYNTAPKIFHQTLIQVVESELNDFGLTIVDGDFLTVLPQGLSGKLLAYGPSVSTRKAMEAKSMPSDWGQLPQSEITKFQEEIVKRIETWFVNWDFTLSDDYLETVRTIEVGVESTDRRTSQVRDSKKGLIDIWSGKIDHAIEISKHLPHLISAYRNQQ